jgi:hypothetical protein
MIRRPHLGLWLGLVTSGSIAGCYLMKPSSSAPPTVTAGDATVKATPDAGVPDAAAPLATASPSPASAHPAAPSQVAAPRPRDLTVSPEHLGPLDATTTIDAATLERIFADYQVSRGTYFVAGVEGEKLMIDQGKTAVLEVYPDRGGNYVVWILHRRIATPMGLKVGDRYRTVERRLRQRLKCRAGADDWYKYQLCSSPDRSLRYVFPNTRGPLRNKRMVAVIWTAPPR